MGKIQGTSGDQAMKSKEARSSFLVPRFVGRSEGDMVARGKSGQLELFRATLTPPAKLQVLAMLALSDPKQLDRAANARAADIARTMGYEPTESGQLPGHAFEAIEETGLKLRRKSFDVFVREPSGKTRDGRRKYSAGIVNLSILQEFGFLYEDDEGQPINLDETPKNDLIKYESVEGPPLYAIPMTDAKGNFLKNKDGSIRRRRANGVIWRWASRFAELTRDKETAWIFYSDAIKILRRYLHHPVAFNLMFSTLFWKGDVLIEMGHEKLIAHLDILGKDRKQVDNAIDAAFKAAFDEGIIDTPVHIRPAGYYKPTKKTGKERRKGKVYQWRRAARWRGGKVLPMVQADGQLEGYNEGKTEKPKE
jgi:hypothetical protein